MEPDGSALTHSYVVLETCALAQRRLGVAAVRDVLERLSAPLEIVWVDEDLHRAGARALVAAGRRAISLVDWISFEVMRRGDVERALAFDRHFADQGFATVP